MIEITLKVDDKEPKTSVVDNYILVAINDHEIRTAALLTNVKQAVTIGKGMGEMLAESRSPLTALVICGMIQGLKNKLLRAVGPSLDDPDLMLIKPFFEDEEAADEEDH